MTVAAAVLLGIYFLALGVLAAYALHRLWLVRLLKAGAGARAEAGADPGAGAGAGHMRRSPSANGWPFVTVQVPLYNERFVAERVIEAVGRLAYPRDRLEVQVLDDSTDETRAIAASAAARLAGRGVDVAYVHRWRREGYKAGALAAGLRRARGELLLVLDADFVPQPDLLLRLVPSFADARVGAVQARWAHLNARQSLLTRAQAHALDAHFFVEQAARSRAGLFLTFNGTAGMWRRAAIEDAGGWRADTLTEDLDLSYRAQLRGWRIVLRDDVAVPAELPTTLAAFKQQQARWAGGTLAAALRHLPAVWRAPLPRRIKLAAFFHLTGHVVYPATLLLALSLVPALAARALLGWELFLIDALLAALTILPGAMFFAEAARRAGRRERGRGLLFLLYTGVALSVSNTRALLRALRTPRRGGDVFERTPKEGALAPRAAGRAGPFQYGRRGAGRAHGTTGYEVRGSPAVRLVESGIALYLLVGIGFALTAGMAAAVPFLALLAAGFVNAASA